MLADSDLALDSEELFAGGMHGGGFVELDRQVQDKYSIRCAPHVTGMLRDTLEWVERWIAVEMNSSDDNPLFDCDGGRVHSGGNFYGGHMGQAMDALKVALANLCDLLDRQLELWSTRSSTWGSRRTSSRDRPTTPRRACITASRGCSCAARR